MGGFMGLQKDLVSDILEVLSIIKTSKEKSTKYVNITEVRKLSTEIVAEREFKKGRYRNYNSAKNTIHDALARRLRPDIENIEDFDNLVEQWFYKNSLELKDILLGHSVDSVQSSKVNKFFQ